MSDQPTNFPNFSKSLTPEAIAITKKFGWDFFKAGVLIVDEMAPSSQYFERGDWPKYALVKEAKVKKVQPDGSKKWVLSDQGKWNLPCGRLQPDESFPDAALREGFEESGYKVRLGSLVHIGHRFDSDNPYVIIIYAATPLTHMSEPNPEEIAEVGWFSYDEIVALRASGELRNPDLTMSALDQYLKYEIIPSNLLVTYPPKFK